MIGIGIGIPFDLRPLVISVFAGAAAAYSMRIPAGSAYNGPLIRVRRSTDNAEQNFGAAAVDANGSRWLDTTALLAFCGAGSGFVTTWYDQSGNGRNLLQGSASAQPRVVNAGVVEVSSGRAAIYTTTGMSAAVNPAPWLVTGNENRTLNSIMSRQSGIIMAMWSGLHSANGAWGIDLSGTNTFAPYTYGVGDTTSTIIAVNTPTITTAVRSAGTSRGFVNGVAAGTNTNAISTSSANGLGIGVRPDGAVSTGWYSEVVYFGSAMSTEARQALERSQGAAFGITVA